MTPLCPKCYTVLIPNCDGEWLQCPKGHVLDLAAEDCVYPGQAFFHKHNPNIKATEERWLRKQKQALTGTG